MRKDEILKNITDKYLSSDEFNGYTLYELEDDKDKPVELV